MRIDHQVCYSTLAECWHVIQKSDFEKAIRFLSRSRKRFIPSCTIVLQDSEEILNPDVYFPTIEEAEDALRQYLQNHADFRDGESSLFINASAITLSTEDAKTILHLYNSQDFFEIRDLSPFDLELIIRFLQDYVSHLTHK